MDKELDLLEELRQKAVELVEAREKCEDDKDEDKGDEKVDDEIVDGAEVEDDEDNEDDDTKSEDKKKKEETKESVDFSSIFAGEELSEEFKLKVTTMFEAVVAQKVSAVEATLVEAMEAMQEEMAQKALDEATELEEGLIERVDGYLDYMVEQWMEKNELALESGIKSDLFESFMSGMQNLFTEHMINVPEDKVEILEQQAEVIDELESKFDELLSENVSLKQTLKGIAKQKQIVEAADGLSDVEAERFMDLAEELSYDNEEVFGKKLVLIREQFFGSTKESTELSESVVSSEPLLESVDETAKQPMSQIAKLAAQISRSKI